MSRYQRHNPDEPVRHDLTKPGTPATTSWRNLGVLNGLSGTPEAVEQCRAAKHKLTAENKGRCLEEYRCEICRLTFQIDSSD